MAVAHPASKKTDWRLLLVVVRKELISLHFLNHALVILTLPLWIRPGAYLFLYSFQVVPDGLLAHLAITMLALYMTARFLDFGFGMAARSRKLKQAWRAVRGGEEGAQEKLRHEQAKFVWNSNVRTLFSGLLALPLMWPPVIALMLWSDMQTPNLRATGAGQTYLSPQRELRRTLAAWERNGILRPFSH